MKLSYVMGMAALAVAASWANASIVGYNCAADGDGAIIMNSVVFDYYDYELNCNGTQHGNPAHVLGDFTTDTELDPVVWVRNTVLNDMEVEPLVWTDYHINMSMNKPFTILDAFTLPDWTFNITQPTLQGAQWVGTVDYYAGTPVNFGQWGEFDLKVSFLGSISYCQEQIPTPEPTSLLLLGLGALVVCRTKK
jgi:hypothetical protein